MKAMMKPLIIPSMMVNQWIWEARKSPNPGCHTRILGISTLKKTCGNDDWGALGPAGELHMIPVAFP